jgi:lysophospholipase L1-like esterase
MRRSLLAVALCATVTVASLPVGASEPADGPVYLALGDSQAFGVGVFPAERLGYAPILGRWVHGVDCREGKPSACPRLELVNLAVPGATSTSLISGPSPQLPDALGLIADRRTDGVAGNEVVLITLTIGGNDLFNPVVNNCIPAPTSACASVIGGVFTTFATNLGVILGSLRAAAGPDVQIIVSTYDNPLAACFLAPFEELGDAILEGGTAGGITVPFGYNQVIEAVAAAVGADVADMFGQLAVDDWVGDDDCTHPNRSGHRKMAQVFFSEVDFD